jgi:3-mercaptopyruvate sulfurtransferase SseA
MFRVFGHEKVWVLDGGLLQWRAAGYDVESSASSDAIVKANAACEAIEKVYQGQSVMCSESSSFLLAVLYLYLQSTSIALVLLW